MAEGRSKRSLPQIDYNLKTLSTDDAQPAWMKAEVSAHSSICMTV
jgi:hypothetical protein